MTERSFYNGLANGKKDIVGGFLELLEKSNVQYCLIGGLAVNAYAEPVVSLDLDIIVASESLEKIKTAAGKSFRIETFEHSVNLNSADSEIRIQIQTDERYQSFLPGTPRKVLGYEMNVATVENVLQGKLWAYQDTKRRSSKRQKDLADIARLIETHPHLKSRVPSEVSTRLER